MRIQLLIILSFFVLGCNNQIKFKEITPTEEFIIKDEYVYLISLEGVFDSESIEIIHKIDPTIKYLLGYGHLSQKKADQKWNYKTAKEFIDVSEKTFRFIKKIKYGGGFAKDSIVLDVIEGSNRQHYVVFANNRNF